jgi:hypothetical protein
MKVEEKGKKVVISEGSETLSADVSGLTKKQIKHLSRQLQIAFLEGKRDSRESVTPKKKATKKKTVKKKEEK